MNIGEFNRFGEELVWKAPSGDMGILRIERGNYDITNAVDSKGYPTSLNASSFKKARKLAYASWKANAKREAAENMALHLSSTGDV